MSIATQKENLSQIIESLVRKRIHDNPQHAEDAVALLVSSLCERLTLKELQEWHANLTLSEMVQQLHYTCTATDNENGTHTQAFGF